MRRRLTFIAACIAISCGGKTQETFEKTGAELCTELQNTADESLQALIAANNTCNADSDCESTFSVGGCYTYCTLPIKRTSVDAVTAAERELCHSYVEHGCTTGFACPNSPGAACIDGRCMFKF